MYVVTNREVRDSATGLEQFGTRPNRKGPNELCAAEIARRGSRWRVTFLDDELPKDEVRALKREFDLPIDSDDTHHVSLCAVNGKRLPVHGQCALPQHG